MHKTAAVVALVVTLVVTAAGSAAASPMTGATAEGSWARHTIAAGWRGADGVNLADVNGDRLLDVATGWEEAGIVTVSLHPLGDGKGAWPTVTVATGLHGSRTQSSPMWTPTAGSTS
jgi:hypothetical protein